MLNAIIAAGGFVFIFGIVVFVHELGHFLAAKWAGVYAPKFSIGFGPGPRRRFGETEYILGVIPLGGYVRMASRDDEAVAFLEGGSEESAARAAEAQPEERPKDWDPSAMVPFGPHPVPANRWFESKPLAKRLVIMLAGVTMNAILAFSIYTGFAAYYGRTTYPTRVIGAIRDVAYTAELRAAAGPGDTIVAIQGIPVQSWNDVMEATLASPGTTLDITTQRGTAHVPAGPPNGPRRQELAVAIDRYVPPIIGVVTPGKPAAVAGLQVGDSIISIDGKPVHSFAELITFVSASPGVAIDFAVARPGAPPEARDQRTLPLDSLSRAPAALHFSIRPDSTEITDPLTGAHLIVGRISAGAGPEETTHEPLSLSESVVEGAQRTWSMTGTIFGTLRSLAARETSVDQLGGPILIAQQAASAAHEGLSSMLALLALLSINLAVLNLLPIPVLDGGQIVLQVAEAVKGRPFSQRTRSYILGTGVAFVLLIMLVVSYNDILRLVR